MYVLFFFLALLALLRFTPTLRLPNSSPWVMPIALGIKFAVGLLFVVVYTYHYGVGELTADGSSFMKDSKVLNEVFYESPADYARFMVGLDNEELKTLYLSETEQWDTSSDNWLNDARNVLRIHSIIHFFSFGHIGIHLLIMGLINLIGLRWLAMAFHRFTKVRIETIFFTLLLMPNVLFWSSGILKEPLIFFSLGLLMHTLLVSHAWWKRLILIALSVAGLLSIKPYLIVCILPAIGVYQLFMLVKNRSLAIVLTILLGVVSLGSLLTKPMRPIVNKLSYQQFDFTNIGKGGVFARADTCIYIIYGQDMGYVILDKEDSTVYLTHEVVGDYVQPYDKKNKHRCTIYPNDKPWKMYYDGEFSGSYIDLTMIKESPQQLLKNIPEALMNVFLRPFPNDPPDSKFKYVSIVDGWGFLILFIGTVFFFRRSISQQESALIAALLTFSIVLALMIGWTTPVLGAIIRYKVPIQLAFALIGFILLHPQKIRFKHE